MIMKAVEKNTLPRIILIGDSDFLEYLDADGEVTIQAISEITRIAMNNRDSSPTCLWVRGLDNPFLVGHPIHEISALGIDLAEIED